MKTKLLIASTALLCATAQAQTFEGNVNGFETPLGMNSVNDIDSPATRVRDERFNRVQVQAPGYGFTATAIGNLVNVVTTGNNNTVQVNATQVNNGSQRVDLSGSNLDASK